MNQTEFTASVNRDIAAMLKLADAKRQLAERGADLAAANMHYTDLLAEQMREQEEMREAITWFGGDV